MTSLTHLAAPLAPGILVDHNQRESVRVAARSRPVGPVDHARFATSRGRCCVGDVAAATVGLAAAYAVGVPLTAEPLAPARSSGWYCWPRPAPTRPGAVGVGLAESLRRVLRAGAGLALTTVALAAIADLAAGPASCCSSPERSRSAPSRRGSPATS